MGREVRHGDIAILFRDLSNDNEEFWEEALRKRNLPYQIIGGKRFYNRPEIVALIHPTHLPFLARGRGGLCGGLAGTPLRFFGRGAVPSPLGQGLLPVPGRGQGQDGRSLQVFEGMVRRHPHPGCFGDLELHL